MSIPSGKSLDPIDHSAIAVAPAPCAPEPATDQPNGSAAGDDEPWLRYAPPRVREGAAMRRLIGGSNGVVQFTAAPTMQPDAIEAEREPAESAEAEPVESQIVPMVGRSAEAVARAGSASVQFAGQARTDGDFAGVESNLRSGPQNTAVGKLPRAAQLPPVPGLSPVTDIGRRGGDVLTQLRILPESAGPKRPAMPPPLMKANARPDHLRAPLRILAASIIAAPIAYYFSVGGWTAQPDPMLRGPKLASASAQSVAPPEMTRPPQRIEPNQAQGNDALTRSEGAASVRPSIALERETPARADRLASALRSTGETQAAPARPIMRKLDPADIKLLIVQGEQFVAVGDLVTARIAFRRAAEAGDPSAAMALGASYDPIVLANLGVRGIEADVDKARSWYQAAKDFGSIEAPRRLELLAKR